MDNIEQKIINTALEFKKVSMSLGKEIKSTKKEELTQEYISEKFENPNKVVFKLFELLDEYEFSRGTSEKVNN